MKNHRYNARNEMFSELIENADLTDAMLEAQEIDQRLPRIIYFRRKRKTLRQIGAECGLSAMQCYRLLQKVTPKILSACGL